MAAVAERLVTALATVTQVEGVGVFQLEELRRLTPRPLGEPSQAQFGIAHSTLEVEEGKTGIDSAAIGLTALADGPCLSVRGIPTWTLKTGPL